MLEYNNPIMFAFSGAIMAGIAGMTMPVVGLILSELMSYLSAPWATLVLMAKDDNFAAENLNKIAYEYLESNIKLWSTIMGAIAATAAIAKFF